MTDDQATLLRELHDQHASALLRFACRLTNDRQLAEDVVQETLFRAWRNARMLETTAEARQAWLFTVARNLVIDDWRSARSRNEIGTDTLPERASADRVDAALEAWLVAEAIATLSLPHREVLVHSFYGQRSVAEIAAHLGIPDGTVKSRLHYGLRALRLALQEKGVTR
ncbi:RNA polymerase subunit sigma [Subtercola sp. Z020]|uniref:sigma-70 family RNA polymerase sigma factor n=1 Tax=Subtercola sp. Z020 TaxID=2080582 RepID=UPI000CE8964D|nr:sigma-70 family RNA polymerase sigma factor [Subtercola sp. Z020]PPF78625.1 RNA polymerase subunit sigma [Subtercola sp. Z020]